jgi:hypothetical protein
MAECYVSLYYQLLATCVSPVPGTSTDHATGEREDLST